MVMVKIHFII